MKKWDMVLRPLRGICIGQSRMGRNWQSSSPSIKQLACLMAAWSCRCCRWCTRLLKQRLSWTAVPAHLTDGVAFSIFHTDPSDKGLVHSKRFRKPSSFHHPPPELSRKNFLQEKHSYGVSSSAILSLSSHVPLDRRSHWGLSKLLISVTEQELPDFVCQQIHCTKLLFFQTCISNLSGPNLH